MSDGILFLRLAADRIGAPGSPAQVPFRATNAATWSPIIRIGAKMVVIRRRMHVERFESHSMGWERSIWGIPVYVASR